LVHVRDCADWQEIVWLWQDVSGAFRPGVLTALVGESGAGKTTLMVCDTSQLSLIAVSTF
jgi:ABC-type multidrug transport system ATPase subunit